jgi:hypothetical protein
MLLGGIYSASLLSAGYHWGTIQAQNAPSKAPKKRRKASGRMNTKPHTKYITIVSNKVVTIMTVATDN